MTSGKKDLRRWLPADKGPTDWLDLQIDALRFALALFEIQYLDGGVRYAKLEYARGVLKELLNDFEHSRKFIETKT